jgi:hypothetical protein
MLERVNLADEKHFFFALGTDHLMFILIPIWRASELRTNAKIVWVSIDYELASRLIHLGDGNFEFRQRVFHHLLSSQNVMNQTLAR